MNFSPKEYLYYTLESQGITNYDKARDCVEILGNFTLAPGSLKLSLEKDEYQNEKRILSSDGFQLENKDFFAYNIAFSDFGKIKISGTYAGHQVLINVDGISKMDKRCNLESTIIDSDKGVYIFNTSYFDHDNGEFRMAYIYYDVNTLKSLRNDYKYGTDDILTMDVKDLLKLGIKPDYYLFSDIESYDEGNKYDFVRRIFTEMPYNEFISKIDGTFIENAESQEKQKCIEE